VRIELEIYAVNVNGPISLDLLDQILKYFPDEIKKKIASYYQFMDYKRSLIGHVLVYLHISRNFNIPFQKIKYIYNQFGKPHIKGDFINFNISHSGDWVVCAFDNKPLGIDIELVKPVDIQVVSSFFSKEEQKRIKTIPSSLRTNSFYELWTLKESFIKAIGKGLSMDLKSFTIKFEEGEALIENSKHFFNQYNIGDYKLAVCSQNRNFPKNIDVLDQVEICEEVIKRHER
jgi:4'-phosphopantetheinyl transferase